MGNNLYKAIVAGVQHLKFSRKYSIYTYTTIYTSWTAWNFPVYNYTITKRNGLLITYYFRKFLMKFINEMETDQQVFSEILKRLQ